jgi:hypothetical protein
MGVPRTLDDMAAISNIKHKSISIMARKYSESTSNAGKEFRI